MGSLENQLHGHTEAKSPLAGPYPLPRFGRPLIRMDKKVRDPHVAFETT